MACLSVICNNGFFKSRELLGVHNGKTGSCSNRSVRGGLALFRLVKFQTFCKAEHGLSCNTDSIPKLSRHDWNRPLRFRGGSKSPPGLSCRSRNEMGSGQLSDIERGYVRKRGSGIRRKYSLRLRPRFRLLASRFKRVSAMSTLNDLGLFLRKNLKRVTLSVSISVALAFCYIFLKVTALPSPKLVPYSDLIMSLQNGNVTKVLLEEGSRRIYYNTSSGSRVDDKFPEEKLTESNAPIGTGDDITEKKEVPAGKMIGASMPKKSSRARAAMPQWQLSTRKIDHDEKFLLNLMREKGTTYSSAPQSVLMSIRSTLITIISLWIPLTPLMWLLYRQLSAANSPAKKRRPNNQSVNFDDVEGVDAAKVELMEIVSCLQGAINYKKLGAKLPRGVLLVGPPGTGKTLLARAVAGEAGVPFFTVSASEFVELFVGRGAARIRDLFTAARKCSPSIIFIDELDAVGGKRGRSFNDERDQTLNQLLTEMDGFESDTKVIVLAATNRPEALDPALCRPGRFSRKVLVGEPDEEGRRRILGVHLRGVPVEEDVELICDLVASLTPGFVGADLANIVNEAALLAARRGGETVLREDIMEAVERAKYGINDKQLRPNAISKELGKLFPWIPSMMGRNDTREDGLQGPMGYQTLSG
ncbi:AAA domain-containing protein [Psidium guajava]|nr:AAA domain-containing protein [Psidium guajava]